MDHIDSCRDQMAALLTAHELKEFGCTVEVSGQAEEEEEEEEEEAAAAMYRQVQTSPTAYTSHHLTVDSYPQRSMYRVSSCRVAS
jgi:hypothetical protein